MSKSRRKPKNDEEDDGEALKQMFERLHERQKLQAERQKKWDEAWERKLVQEEQCENLRACCAPDEYFPAPRAQSNIWLQVSHEAKNTQRVQLSFTNTTIPKPDPPPCPRMPLSEIRRMEAEEDKKLQEVNKKKTKKKK